MHAALATGPPTDLPRSGIKVALDFHDEPLYCKDAQGRQHARAAARSLVLAGTVVVAVGVDLQAQLRASTLPVSIAS